MSFLLAVTVAAASPACQPKSEGGDDPPGGGGAVQTGGSSPPTSRSGGSSSTPPSGGSGGSHATGGSGLPSGGSSGATPAGSGGQSGASTGGQSGAGTGGQPAAGGSGGANGDTGAPPPVSGETITIGGAMVPKEKAIVFIHVGHSDMLGRADSPAALRSFFFDTDPHLWVYRSGGTFAPAKEPTAGTTPSAGPGMALLKTALGLAPDATFISIGHGHSGADGGHCANFRKGKPLWNTFGPAALELKGKVTFGGIFTMFGITEYRNGDAGLNGMADCQVGLAADIRTELGDPNIPLMVGDWNASGTGIYAPSSSNGMTVRPLIQMIPGRDPRAAIIPTTGLPMEDDRHLNMAGHKMWAERGLKIMMERGWAPWAK